jgi:hypothetical protein
MELVRLLRSVELHEDAKVTVKEIVSMLSEFSCAARPEGPREVLIAGSSSHQKKGKILYEFCCSRVLFWLPRLPPRAIVHGRTATGDGESELLQPTMNSP